MSNNLHEGNLASTSTAALATTLEPSNNQNNRAAGDILTIGANVVNGNRVTQLVNNVNINNLIQSNSFLQSDLGNFIEASSSSRHDMNQTNQAYSHSHQIASSQNDNQIILDLPNANTNNNNNNNTNNNEESIGQQQNEQQAPANNLITAIIKSLQSSLPFFIILITKIFHQHLLGFFIVFAFMTTLHWSNSNLCHQVELKVITKLC
jgi:hypothetical protein